METMVPIPLPRPRLASWDSGADLKFQVLDWYVPESDRARWLPNVKKFMEYPDVPPKYEIFMYGVTELGHSVCVKTTGFEPYFFVKLPEKMALKSDSDIKADLDRLRIRMLEESYMGSVYDASTGKFKKANKKIIPYRLKKHLDYVKLVKRKDFWGFTNGKKFAFMKVKVRSLALFNMLKRYFQDISAEGYALYESNIDPFLRFIHERNLSPCGWVRLNGGTYTMLNEVQDGSQDGSQADADSNFEGDADVDDEDTSIPISRAQLNVEVSFADVHREEINKIAPLLIASFDIECTSSHGDFPLAKKSYFKVAQDLVQMVRLGGIVPTQEVLTDILSNLPTRDFTMGECKVHRVYPKQRADKARWAQCAENVVVPIREWLCKCKEVQHQQTMEPEDEASADTEVELDEFGVEIVNKRSDIEHAINGILKSKFPALKGDPIIQIGTTVHIYGSDEIVYKHIVTLNSCDPIEGVEVESYDKEEMVLLAWKDILARLDPDVLIGYNTFGFDMAYIWDRADELDIEDTMSIGLGRLNLRRTGVIEQKLSSSALGDNFLRLFDLDGIVSVDMYKVMQREHKLDSYKLDHVASTFLGDNKNDLKPREIFEKFEGTSADRCEVAKYCLQDCALVNRLLHKLKVIENNVGMGNVCSVPLSYLFMRGQGIKIFSLVAKECRARSTLIPVVKLFDEKSLDEDGVGYEGAIVLEPKEGMYLDDPITVLDYSSLYPSSMIARNLSHDCYVMDDAYRNLGDEGITYETVTYDEYSGVGDKKHISGKKSCTFAQLPNDAKGNPQKGIIPSILMKLLAQRKNTRKRMEYKTLTLSNGESLTGLLKEVDTDDTYSIYNAEADTTRTVAKTKVVEITSTYSSFEAAVLDALQLAYKITANSLYGQIGSRTSAIFLKEIAACTTATGREMIMTAKEFVETQYNAEVIYGDTDSIFCKFPNKDAEGNALKGMAALPYAIEAGKVASVEIKAHLPPPQCLEYEKTLYPFIILSKKRYVGNLYTTDHTKAPKQKSMGIVLVRRDNAPIVKKIYGGVINILLNEQDLDKSVRFLQVYLNDLVEGRIPLEDLIVTKTLGSNYKNPKSIAHKVLADRMSERDAGNKPQVNDRVPYVYIVPPPNTEIQMQGDRIEDPNYIREQGLTPDYRFYITNQIMKPVSQLFALCVERLTGYDCTSDYWNTVDEMLKAKVNYSENEAKRKDKLTAMRMEMVQHIIFQPFLERLPEVILRKPKAKSKAKANSKLFSSIEAASSTSTSTSTSAKKERANARAKIDYNHPGMVLHVTIQETKKNKKVSILGKTTLTQTIPERKIVLTHEREELVDNKAKVYAKARMMSTLAEFGLRYLFNDSALISATQVTGLLIQMDKGYKAVLERAMASNLPDKDKTMLDVNLGGINETRETKLWLMVAEALHNVPHKVVINDTKQQPASEGLDLEH